MDPNGGFDPLSQGQGVGQSVPGVQPQFQQQAPMASLQAAYAQPSAAVAQPVAPATSSMQPIQDIKPGWQQDLQYSAPVDPPWVQPPAQVQQNSPISTYDSFRQPELTPEISPNAYSILTESFDDIGQSALPSKKSPLLMVVITLVVLIAVAGAGFGGYTFGYNKGVAEKAATTAAQNSTKSDEDKKDTSQQPTEPTEPELSFELSISDYKEETLMGSVGEQLQASDGLVVNAYRIDTEYIPESAESESASGSFVKVDLLLGNADDSRPKTIKTSDFKLLDEFDEFHEALDASSDGLGATGSVTLSPGMKSRISIVYSVASQGWSYQLVRSQPYQVGGQNRTVAMSIDLTSTTTASEEGYTRQLR